MNEGLLWRTKLSNSWAAASRAIMCGTCGHRLVSPDVAKSITMEKLMLFFTIGICSSSDWSEIHEPLERFMEDLMKTWKLDSPTIMWKMKRYNCAEVLRLCYHHLNMQFVYPKLHIPLPIVKRRQIRTGTRREQLWIRLSPELAGFLIICWVFGLIWKACLSSLIWYMATCSPIRSDWVTDQNVESFWPSQAQLRKPKKYTKFNVVLSILNHLHL